MTTRTRSKRLSGPMSARLRQARTEAGLSQQHVATAIGVVLKTVNNYENPNYAGARKRYVVKEWAELCGREFEELWGTRRQPLDRTGWFSPKPVRRTRAA